MSYEYDIFISYRRHGVWPQWIRSRFIPIFEHWLGEELGTDARVFWDDNLEKAKNWPTDLGIKLAASKILVPLWSRQYFNSSWCKTELSLMCAREDKCGFGKGKKPERLIVPAIIHDGEELPHFIRNITAAELQDYSNVWVVENSPTLEALSNKVRNWVPDVARAIHRAPEYDSDWVQLAIDEFVALFEVPEARQNLPPSLGLV